MCKLPITLTVMNDPLVKCDGFCTRVRNVCYVDRPSITVNPSRLDLYRNDTPAYHHTYHDVTIHIAIYCDAR